MMLIDAEVPHANLKAIIEKSFPSCESVGGSGGVLMAKSVTSTEAKRNMPTRWPHATYIDPNGVPHEYDSPSALYEKLTGVKLSGSICVEGGTRCYPATTVESFRIQGYTVLGNGEEPPASDEKNWLQSNNVKRSETLEATNAWKEHLLATGKKFVVVDPIWIKRKAEQIIPG